MLDLGMVDKGFMEPTRKKVGVGAISTKKNQVLTPKGLLEPTWIYVLNQWIPINLV